jgi:hypothetical protein
MVCVQVQSANIIQRFWRNRRTACSFCGIYKTRYSECSVCREYIMNAVLLLQAQQNELRRYKVHKD